MKKLLTLTALTLALTGCVLMAPKPPTPEQEAKANYGSVTKKEAERLIRQHLGRTLLDPYSYELTLAKEFKKHWAVDSEGKYHYGQITMYWVNAKNAYGGYTGEKNYVAFFEDGQIAQIYTVLTGGDDTHPNIYTMR